MSQQPPPYNAYFRPKPFISANSRARMVTVLLAIGAISQCFSLVIRVLEFVFFPTGDVSEMSSDPVALLIGFAELGLGLAQVAIYIATIVVFLMWLHRSYENLPALGVSPRDLKYSSGWAVGSFFVPFVNLVVPYRAVVELWGKSAPHATRMFGQLSAPEFIKQWWALWIISNIVNNIYSRMVIQSEAPSVLSLTFGVLSDVLDIAAAMLAIKVVREIDRRQTERSRFIRPQYPATPPPPPSFGSMPPPQNSPI